jgi:carboxypeptidase PM20D1
VPPSSSVTPLLSGDASASRDTGLTSAHSSGPVPSLFERLSLNWPTVVLGVLSIVQGLAFNYFAERFVAIWNSVSIGALTAIDYELLASSALCFAVLIRVFQTYLVAALDYYDWPLNLYDVLLIFVVGLIEYGTFSMLTPDTFDLRRFQKWVFLIAILGFLGYANAYFRLPQVAIISGPRDPTVYKAEKRLQLFNVIGMVGIMLISAATVIGPHITSPARGVWAATVECCILLVNTSYSIRVLMSRDRTNRSRRARHQINRPITVSVAAAAVVFLAVLVYRAFSVRSRQLGGETDDNSAVDLARITRVLSAAIQIPTVTSTTPANPASGVFEAFRELLDRSFPLVHTSIQREIVNQRSLLYVWKGSAPDLAPIVMLAHSDVVPASPNGWKVPPFSGVIEGDTVWGRGALDDKGSAIAIVEALESLLEVGYRPRRTVYIAIGHDEEADGSAGAVKLAEVLRHEARAAILLDEGGGVLSGVIPGFSKPVASVGVAEKGYLDVELEVNGEPGHSSVPTDENPIQILSAAILRLRDHPEPVRFTPVISQMLEYGAAEMTPALRMVATNLWLFRPLVIAQMAENPLTQALLRTTVTPTMLSAGDKANVLPERARAVVNARLLPGDSSSALLNSFRATIGDPRVVVRVIERSEPPPVSDIDSVAAHGLLIAVRRTFPGAIILPVLTPGTTDSRHYTDVAEQIFRFSPFRMDRAALEQLHGRDERISLKNCESAVRFYRQFIRSMSDE